MTDVLNLWLHGEHLGTVQQPRTGRTRLRFSDDVVQQWGIGTRLLSYSLPMTNRRLDTEDVANFLDNLLPEGAVRAQFEQRYRLRPGDAFGLLTQIGVECAGAVQLTVDDVPPDGRLVPLTDAETTRIVTELPTLSAPEGGTLSASLGGVQSKVLLTRTDDGWAWPAAGAMSTHIIKPEPTDPHVPIRRIIEYEHWAMSLAAAAGIPAARTELMRFGDRLALVVERYDRAGGRRLHQEDFAQALGIRAGDKYEATDEPASRLSRIADGPGLEAQDPASFRRALLRLVTFNLLVGNGDAHAKNYSLILRDGVFELAPAYDVAPVFYVNPRFSDFGMRLAGQRNLRYLNGTHLLDEAVQWGMSRQRAQDVVAETVEGVRGGLERVSIDDLVEPIADRVLSRAVSLL